MTITTACPTPAALASQLGRAGTPAPWAGHVGGCAACRRALAAAVRATADPVARRVADWLTDTAATELTPHLATELAAGAGDGLLLGPYLLTRLIARGGMGAVYEGWHSLLRRTDAVKVMADGLLASASAVARFRREVESLARLRHPNVVAVYAADRHAGRYYLAMEFIRGEDLSRRARRLYPMPVAEVCDALRQAARGFQHAHEMGLVHRDVKPGNLLREDGGRVVVADFGIVRWGVDPDGPDALTGAGAVLGTPAFMAPEQVEDSRRVDIRADLYSLGATAFFLLTARPPFVASSSLDVLLAHRSRPAPDVRSVRPEVPAAVAAVVARLLKKDPADRFQTPAELERALARIADNETSPGSGTPADDDTRPWDDSTNGRTATPLPPARRWRRSLALVGAAVVVPVLATVLATLLMRGPTPTDGTRSPEPPADPPADGVHPPPPLPPDTGGKGRWVPARTTYDCPMAKKVTAVGYAASGTVVAADASGMWATWDHRAGGSPTKSGRFPGVKEGGTPEYYLPATGHFLSSMFDRWTTAGAAAGKLPVALPGLADTKASYLGGGAASADGKWFAAGVTMTGGDNPPVGVVLWDPTATAATAAWKVETKRAIKAVAVTPGGTVAAATQDGTLHVWPRGGVGKSWPGPSRPAVALALVADGTILYSVHADTHELRRTDAGSGTGRKVGLATGQCNRLTVSPDGRWLVAGGYGLRVWRLSPDPADAETLLPAEGIMVEDVAFDAAGRRLLIGAIADGRPLVREFELWAE